LEKRDTFEKLVQTTKNGNSFGKECVTLGKKGAHLRKRVTLGNMGSTWKYG